jgi:hypothetical protein
MRMKAGFMRMKAGFMRMKAGFMSMKAGFHRRRVVSRRLSAECQAICRWHRPRADGAAPSSQSWRPGRRTGMNRNLFALAAVVVAAMQVACNQDGAPAPPSGPVPPTEMAVASPPVVAAAPAPAPAPVETGTPAPTPAKDAVRGEPMPAPPSTTPRIEATTPRPRAAKMTPSKRGSTPM